MKAYELRAFGFENLSLGERPEPKPGHGQAVVRMRAVSLNYRDLLVLKGLYSRRLNFPLVPCSDGAGEVLEVGPGVTRVKPGDRVAATFMQGWVAGKLTDGHTRTALGGAIDGVLAEQVLLSEEGLVAIPDHLSFEEASTLPCAAVTAWHGLMADDGVRPGATVLTMGSGGVSIFTLQFAQLAGAQVAVTSSSDEKLERLKELGAAYGINYKKTPEWDIAAREWTGGLGVDHVVELGGAGTLPKSLKAVRANGHISLIGVLAGQGDANPILVTMKNLRMQGIFVGSREMFEAMNRAIAVYHVRPAVDRIFGFPEALEALHYLESGAHFGKVVIRIE
jgi:NADPH:quinone reductase-like Zn-dependent oxidoreductase